MKEKIKVEDIKKSLSEDDLVSLIRTINDYNNSQEISNILSNHIKWFSAISEKDGYNYNKTGMSVDKGNIIIFYEEQISIDGEREDSESIEILTGECQSLFEDLLKSSVKPLALAMGI